jgi:predicted hotdog family 3-hydroxylacyl-ACP dehydratase
MPSATGHDQSRPPLPLAAQELLRHRPPMLLVAALTGRSADCATATAMLPTTGIWHAGGRLLPEYFVELVAQTTALANGYDSRGSGRPPRDGMLVGVDAFTWHDLLPGGGGELRIEIRKVFEFGAVRIIHGEVYAGGNLVAAGEIKVWEAADDG